MSQTKLHRQLLLSYLPRIINLVVVPLQINLLTKNLSIEDYGIWNMLLSSGFVATMIFSLGLQKVLSIKVPGRSLYIQLSFFKSILIAESIAYVGLSLIFLVVCLPWLMPLLNIETNQDAIIVILIAFLINLVYNEFGRLLNYQKRIEARILIVSFEKLLELSLLYGAIYWLNITNINHLAFIYILLYLTLLCGNLILFRGFQSFRDLRLRINIIKYALIFGAPLILSDIAWKLIQNVDLYMLAGFDRKSDLGLYAFISRLVNYIYLASSPIIWVVYPYLVEAFHKAGSRFNEKSLKLLQNQLNYSLLFLAAATGALLINIDWLVQLLATKEYKPNIVSYLIYAPYPLLITLMYLGQQILLLEKKAKLISLSYIIGLILNIVGNLILIPKFGLDGAILTTQISVIAILVIQSTHFSIFRYISLKSVCFVIIQVFMISLLLYLPWSWPVKNLFFMLEISSSAMLFGLFDVNSLHQHFWKNK